MLELFDSLAQVSEFVLLNGGEDVSTLALLLVGLPRPSVYGLFGGFNLASEVSYMAAITFDDLLAEGGWVRWSVFGMTISVCL